MKRNNWMAALAALLAVGVLIGVVVWFGKGTSGGGAGGVGNGGTNTTATAGPAEDTTKKPAETIAEIKRQTVLTNATAKYGYRENTTTGEVAYMVYSDELKPNTKYSILFNFSESDHKTFTDTNGLSFSYTYALNIPQDGEGFGYKLTISGGSVKVGYDYDFETNENGTVVFRFLMGSIPSGDSAAKLATYTEICNYIRDNMLFQISEIVG